MTTKGKSNSVNNIIVGKLLKAIREESGETQLSIATEMGYTNSNFIYLIEQGRSAIPINKLMDMLKAYKASSMFAAACVKVLHPDIWDVMESLVGTHYNAMADMKGFGEKVEGVLLKEAKEHGLDDLLQLR